MKGNTRMYENEAIPYEPNPFEIACFELFGRRLANGKIQIGDDGTTETILDNFPAEVRVCGAVYTLEDIKKNVDADGNIINNIEWGVYC
jgi:hypothetical protein